MKPSIPYWQTVGFVFTSVLGTALHFLFDLTGGSLVAAVFSAVNESIWEHMKLLYFPMLLFALGEYYVWGRECSRFACIKLLGVLTGLLLIPITYYTYTGILGQSFGWFNIAIFFLAAGAAYYLETVLFRTDFVCPVSSKTAWLLLFAIGAVFAVLTFAPPRIPFFRDPVTDTYGFQKWT